MVPLGATGVAAPPGHPSALTHNPDRRCPTLARQAVGPLLSGLAATLGIPDDVVVAPGGGDNAMAALGIGAVDPGTVVMSLGTSGEEAYKRGSR